MKRLKILMLTRLFPSRAFPAFGTFCMERAKALAVHADVRVMVPTPYYPNWLPGKEDWKKWTRVERQGTVEGNIHVTYPRYASLPGTATWLQGVTMARCARHDLEANYADWRPDVIDGHFAFPDGYAAVQLGRSIGVPVVVTCHGSDLRQYPEIPVAGAMTRWTLRHADRVISVSSDLMRRSIELGCAPEKAVFLTNGVDPAKFSVRAQSECRAQLSLPLDRKIGVYVGFLIDRKDQSLILRALVELRSQGKSVPLIVLVGDGPNRQRLENEVAALELQNDVILTGQRRHDEVAIWMGAADWLLLSSSSEGWATVYFEAMACGRPVLTSNVSSAKDAISQPAYGSVVEPRTAAAFAAAMQAAAQTNYDENVIRRYAEQNSWQKWADNAMRLFASRVKK
ncbi:MAG: teichuronic acid biosynthesis glycosyltransferase TuaC [Rugosibacter sp.]|nr:teichuronic acid biosynthesis glycosyltransferase TuaC [Rugosibacter sp.]